MEPNARRKKVDENRAVMDRYFAGGHQDLSMLADDVVFTDMATGQESRGREGVRAMLRSIYSEAFDASAVARARLVDADHAVWEGTFQGRHTGMFAGIPATGRTVSVPLTVVYDLANGQIQAARIYLMVPVMMQQLNADAVDS